MKLAALGVVTVGIGILLGVPGLTGIGLFWVVMGVPARLHGRRLKELRAGDASAVDGRTFALGTLLLVGLGVPSLVVGILEIGIDAEHADWRWLPTVVGGAALAVGVLGGVLYLAGSAVLAVGSKGPKPSVPAVLRIRAARETGTFVNERPRMELDLLVEPDAATGVAAYEVTKRATVPFTAMGSLRVGGGFRALVAGPESPTVMEIHWDEPVPESAPESAPAGSESTPAGSDPALDVAARLDELDHLRRDGRVSEAEYQAQRQRILGSL